MGKPRFLGGMKLDAYSISERSDGFRDEAEERDARPRWVYSVWRLVGTPDDIDKIAATGLKFHAIMPMPKPFVCTFMLPEAEIDGLNLEKTHGHRDWGRMARGTLGDQVHGSVHGVRQK